MALKSTVFKATLSVADIDRQNYGDYTLTLARHPSETDERMMVRVLVFALHAHEHLLFGKGLSDPDEPDLWRKDLTGIIEEWIELGQPDEKAIMRACGRSNATFVYCYGGGAMPWWKRAEENLGRAKNLSVRRLVVDGPDNALAAIADRTMELQVTIQDGQLLLHGGDSSLTIDCITLK